MKTCPHCNVSNNDDFIFCQNCGGSFVPPVQPQAPVQPQQSIYVQPSPQTAVHNGFVPAATPQSTESPALLILKESLGGQSFLVIGILFAASVLISLIASLSSLSASRVILNEFFENLDSLGSSEESLNLFRYGFNSFLTGAGSVSIFISMIPNILLIIGFFHSYVSARKPGSMKTTGLSIFKGIAIFNIVILCAAAVVVLVVFIVAAAVSGLYAGIFFLFVLLALAILTLPLFFYIYVIKTVNSLKATAIIGTYDGKVSPFVGVMLYIMGGFSVFSIIGALSSFGNGVGAILFFSYAATCVMYFMLGAGIFAYRRKMTASYYMAMPPMQQTVYVQPVYTQPVIYTQPTYTPPQQPVQYQQPQQSLQYQQPQPPVQPPVNPGNGQNDNNTPQ